MSRPGLQDDKFCVKVVIIGDSGVGKTSIAQRFAQDSFSENTAMSVGGKCQQNAKMSLIILLFKRL